MQSSDGCGDSSSDIQNQVALSDAHKIEVFGNLGSLDVFKQKQNRREVNGKVQKHFTIKICHCIKSLMN